MGTIKIIASNNDQIEYEISRENQLKDLLYDLIKQWSRVIILEISGVVFFTLGVGQEDAFLQYSKDGEPPYLIAVADEYTEVSDLDNEIVFDANGTPTPILKRLCLPYDRVVDTIIYFFKNNEMPRFINWVQI
jgi:hypothetical protein